MSLCLEKYFARRVVELIVRTIFMRKETNYTMRGTQHAFFRR